MIRDIFRIQGKVALVTGGSRGIGFMIAKAYVESGIKVYITSRTVDQCQTAAKALSNIGTCIAIPSDIATEAGRQSIVETITKSEGTLDILVNNAGIEGALREDEKFDEYPESRYDQVMAINLKAPFRLTQQLFTLLCKDATHDNPARVINIGSVLGVRPPQGKISSGSYGPSKAAVHFMTKEFASLLGRQHIICNAIAPGYFKTPMTTGPDGEFDNEFQQFLEQTLPVGRLGCDADIAGLAVFLASKASSYITGELIKVDGGMTL